MPDTKLARYSTESQIPLRPDLPDARYPESPDIRYEARYQKGRISGRMPDTKKTRYPIESQIQLRPDIRPDARYPETPDIRSEAGYPKRPDIRSVARYQKGRISDVDWKPDTKKARYPVQP